MRRPPQRRVKAYSVHGQPGSHAPCEQNEADSGAGQRTTERAALSSSIATSTGVCCCLHSAEGVSKRAQS